MNEISTSKGVLKWRNPTVFENMKMLRAAREQFAQNDIIGAKLVILEMLGPLLNFDSMETIKSYEELVQDGDEMTAPLNEIADQLLLKVTDAFKKKS